VITVHEPVKYGILIKHGFAPEAIDVVANFADAVVFPLRATFSIDRIHLVFHGTILERSGLRIFMDSLARVTHKDRIAVTIIGEGDFSQTLKGLIRSLGLENIVEFDNNSYPAHLVAERIRNCNVGIVPLEISSATEYALPLKLLEYVSLGLPVVCVRNAAISHYFTQEDCIFFDWNDPSSLSGAIDRILEHPEILIHYRERSLVVRQKLSWIDEKTKYVALLHKLAGYTSSV
jgi:glycosyltransferase involved in cell wall biosynthesis